MRCEKGCRLIRLFLFIGGGNLLSLASIFFLNNYESVEAATLVRQHIIFATTITIFLCFGVDQYLPRFNEGSRKIILTYHFFLISIFAIISFLVFHKTAYYRTIMLTAATGAVIHLYSNHLRALDRVNKYLLLSQVVTKLIYFSVAYLLLLGANIELVLMIVILFFNFRLVQKANLKKNSSEKLINWRPLIVTAVVSFVIVIFLRSPYFIVLLLDEGDVIVNSYDLITTLLLLCFMPVQQLQKIREAKSEFSFAIFSNYNAIDTLLASILILFGYIFLFIFGHLDLLFLTDDFHFQYLSVSAIYLAYFASRNSILIWSISDTESSFVKSFNIKLIFLLSSAIVLMLADFIIGLYVLALSTTFVGYKHAPKHVNTLALVLSIILILARGVLTL